MEGTEALRLAAPDWSLAGDQQLLSTLQDLHQRIISKCTETNMKLDEMTSSLDDAGVSLQNINNKFTALSNSQFIESRVYDDDLEIVNEAVKPVEQPQPKTTGPDLESIRRSLQVLESMHESVTILCDSDSDSDDEENVVRVVLKPKDLYADRPLPHIIGSQAWKNKWHAGLLIDESDSDENETKPEARDSEQYSDSGTECSEFARDYPSHSTALQGAQREARTISSSSSDVPPSPVQVPTPADVAAELARRLGGAAAMPAQPIEYSPPEPAIRKVYKPEKPTPGNIFSDEPPPLEMDQSEESDDDIFAQINKSQPYKNTNKDQNSIAEDLFGTPIFEDVEQKMPPPKQKSTLFEEKSEPELFAGAKPQVVKKDDTLTKKPVGGMSLFGTNKNAESIGAAILKRNQRTSSTSGDESDELRPQIKQNKPQIKNSDVTEHTNKPKQATKESENKNNNNNVERDIFDDLFARSEKINKAKETEKIKDKKDNKNSVDLFVKAKEPQKKIDVFADNLFDDIDDIFTTDIKTVKVNNNDKAKPKSIFDDDDLFSDIAVTKNKKDNTQTTVNKATSIFDSDEDLFTEKLDAIKTNNEPKTAQISTESNKIKVADERVSAIVKDSKGLFDDSDDELFSNTKASKVTTNNANASERKNTKSNIDTVKSVHEGRDSVFDEEGGELFKNKETTKQSKTEHSLKPNLDISKAKNDLEKGTKPNVINSPNLFDDDDGDGADLFKTTPTIKSNDNEVSSAKMQDDEDLISNNNPDLKTKNNFKDDNINAGLKKSATESNKEMKSSIFENDFDEDIFSKPKSEIEAPKQEILDYSLLQKSPNVFEGNEFEDNEKSTETDQTRKTPNTTEIAKPDISRKPVIAPKTERTSSEILKTSTIDALDNAVIETVPDNKQVVDSNRNVTEEFTDENFEREVNQSDPDQETTVKPPASNCDDVKSTHSIQSSYSNTTEPKPEAIDMFSDIFNDQPPIFEKPKEPKRSKNINALFDDDSDDEALFLRKTEIVEEKPVRFSNTSDDKLFGIFRDEPPDMDVDELFIDKNNTSKIKPDTNDFEENRLKNVSTSKVEPPNFDIHFAKQTLSKANLDFVDNKVKKDVFSDVTEDIFKKPTSHIFDDEDESTGITDMSVKDIDSFQKDITQTDIEKSEKSESDRLDSPQVESKKIGKLKPMNLNINVNSLLPGASPKKVSKSVEQTDGQVITKSSEDPPIDKPSEDFDPKLAKSVSFEGKPDSPILDNKLSKDRAKIQVKRRPSTRRARREAVKKSGIDFGEDNTDTSIEQSNPPELINNAIITDDNNENINTASQNEKEATKDFVNDTQSNIQEITVTTSNIEQNVSVTKESEVSHTTNDVKSKLVYILNDEDIFNVPTYSETKILTKKLEIVDDLDVTDKGNDLNIVAVTESPINTLGKVYNAPKDLRKDYTPIVIGDENLFKQTSKPIKTTNTDLAQTDSNEDLFKAKKDKKTDNNLQETKHTTVKNEPHDIFSKPQVSKLSKSLFDEIDDEELFSANKKSIKSTDKMKIFDSDSDEDLFGNKITKREVKSTEREVKSIEREVKDLKRVEVKGSLFGDEDDDDLFGAKVKKTEQPQSSKAKAPSSTKEVQSKTTEPVSVDPLSLFGDEED